MFRYNGTKLPIRDSGGVTKKAAPMVVDTGAALIYMPTTALQAYADATGLQYDPASDFYYVPAARLKALRDLDIVVNGGNTVLTLSPAAQLFPPAVSAAFVDPALGQASVVRDRYAANLLIS